jgi:hypothetical protein
MAFPTTVIFPDVDLLLTQRLRAALAARPEPFAADVTVGTEVPNQRDDRMVIVQRAGGPRVDWVRERARVTFQAWGPTAAKQEAADLANLVRALVADMCDGRPVIDVRESSGPVRVYDDSGQPLVTFTLDITVRGTDFA